MATRDIGRRVRWTALVAAGAALLALGCTAQPAATSRSVTIATSTLPASAAVYVANDQGYFQDEGLDATLDQFASGKLALGAVLDGDADIATVADTPLVRAVLDGQQPVIVATIATIDGANVIVARRDRAGTSVHGLVGRRVGVLQGTSADFFLHIYLVTSGVSRSDLEIVPLETGEIVDALVEGRVDAIAAFAPYTIEARERLGTNAVVLDQPGLYTTFWNIAVGPDEATDPDTIARFLRAVQRANEFMIDEPAKAQAITAEATGVSRASIAEQWSSNHWTLDLSQPLILTLEDEARWMSGRELTPNFLGYINTAPLRAVDPAGVGVIEPEG